MATPFFPNISLWEFFQTFKGSLLRSRWSNQAKIGTRPSSHTCHCYLQVWKGTTEKQPRKSGDTFFPIITLSVTMETSGGIWQNFKLIKALMYLIITCKYGKDLIKNSREKMETSFFPLYTYGDFFRRSRAAYSASAVSGPNKQKFEIV